MPTDAAPPGGARPSRARAAIRIARRAVLIVVAVAAAWIGLSIHPQPLFAYNARRANVVLHARQPLPPEAGVLLDEVVRRLALSPLYKPARSHDVFLCDTPALFAMFALWDRRVGGIAQVHLAGNVFIRPVNLAHGRVIGPSGDEKPGERTLAYYVTHEVAHVLTAEHVGRWRYFRLAAFQREGYADHVGFGHAFDLARGRAQLAAGVPEMNPRQSGLYRRYELLVVYLLQRRGMTVEQLLERPLDARALEAELIAEETPSPER